MAKGRLKALVFRCKVGTCKFKARTPTDVRAHYFKAHPAISNTWRLGRHASRIDRGVAAGSLGLPTKRKVGRPPGSSYTSAPILFCPNCGEKLRSWRRLQ